MINRLIKKAGKTFLNAVGWHTPRKIVVMESDDWGSIRMPSLEAYNSFLRLGYHVDQDPYSKFDSLESEDDLTNLFEVLSRYKDKNGNSAVITANAVMANPDFGKIKESNFEQYFYEPFFETFKRYPQHGKCYDLWHEGIRNKIFRPQFHGREHLNIALWLEGLQKGLKGAHHAFNFETFALNTKDTIGNRQNYMAAFDYYTEAHESFLNSVLEDGLNMFEKMFTYRSTSFIAPCYTWGERLESKLSMLGIKYIQGIAKQKVPNPLGNGYSSRFRRCGERNNVGQYYTVRNCFFEPSQSERLWGVDACLANIDSAFRWNTPAIIGTHRVNFIGFLDKKNRDTTLDSLSTLLSAITTKWPNAEFMTSDELGALIEEDKLPMK